MSVCLYVSLYTFFSGTSKAIGIQFGSKFLFAPEKVLKLQYLGKLKKSVFFNRFSVFL